ncbi:MAG: hypothetical protein IME98_03290 [Proteobacteria bacterium]|nr:hypothetical protein [Pseudomonadota bacterium]
MPYIDQKLSLLLVLFFSPVLILAIHILFSRIALVIKSRRPPQFICVIAIIFANLPFILLLCALSLNPYRSGGGVSDFSIAPTLLYALIVFNLVGYTYFHIYNMSETARRVRILYDIYSKGSLAKSDIDESYKKDDMVAIRLERLLGLGQIRKEKGAYFLDGRVLYYGAVLLAFWSRLIGLSIMPDGYRKKR